MLGLIPRLPVGHIRSRSLAKAKTTPPSGWQAPYSIPSSGAAVAINTNTAQDIRPSSHTSDDWLYCNFQQYGGGTFVEDYSDGGAYVIAGSGGHTGPGYTGALIFDFADAAWKRKDNSNGIANSSAAISSGYDGEGELTAATSGNIPAPYHPYALMHALSVANGGGTKGSIVCAYRVSATTGATTYMRSMQLDLDTGLWERFSTNGVNQGGGSYGDNCSSAYDPTENCLYALPSQIHAAQNFGKLPIGSPTWTTVGGYDWPSDRGQSRNCFVHDAARKLVAGTGSGGLRSLDLTSPSSGWVDQTVTGTLPAHDFTWAYYPTNGKWYTRGDTGSVYELTSTGTNTWTVTTTSFTGATLANAPSRGNGALHNTRFFYVPAIDCLAWIPSDVDDVVIMKP
jgi:hypothetical protein